MTTPKNEASTKLPEGVTEEMVADAKERYGAVSQAVLTTAEGEYLEDIVVHAPSGFIMTEFEKQLDRNSEKAKKLLINGCIVGADTKKRIAALGNGNVLFNAAFAACSEMLPIGKATMVKL